MEKSIITSASNKFFPSLINMLGSLHHNYPNHPAVVVYDLGLLKTFRHELESIPFVSVKDIPHFSLFWRSCYTWKTYILSKPQATINLYLDAGLEVLRPLDDFFDSIKKDGYLAVGQVTPLEDITPTEYRALFPIDQNFYKEQCITAGIFGYSADPTMQKVTKELFEAAQAGLCLGFSVAEQYRNKGVNKTIFIRNCKIFRHDTTLLSLFMRKHFGDFIIRDSVQYGGAVHDRQHANQYIWNMRLNYKTLRYLDLSYLHTHKSTGVARNRFIINTMIQAKRLLNRVKGK